LLQQFGSSLCDGELAYCAWECRTFLLPPRKGNLKLTTKLLSNLERCAPRPICVLLLNRDVNIGNESVSRVSLLSVNAIADDEPLQLARRFRLGLCLSNRRYKQSVPICLFESLAANFTAKTFVCVRLGGVEGLN
jgi:hypothetical protein